MAHHHHVNHTRGCLSWLRLSLPTAALVIAFLGILTNLQELRLLSDLEVSLSHDVAMSSLQPIAAHPTMPLIDLHMPALAPLSAFPAVTAFPSQTPTSSPSKDDTMDLHSWRLFNVLSVGQGGSAGRKASVGSGEAQEQARWDALRVLVRVMHVYLLISIACCIAGVAGVVKSQLYLTRIFVVHSALDLFLCILSFLSFALLCTYPAMRTHVCEQMASGELRPWSSTDSSLSARWSLLRRSKTGSESLMQTEQHGLGSLVELALASEDCDESFGTIIVPAFLTLGLLYTALRIRFFLTVHHFYKALLRERTLEYTMHSRHSLAASTVPMRHTSSSKRSFL